MHHKLITDSTGFIFGVREIMSDAPLDDDSVTTNQSLITEIQADPMRVYLTKYYDHEEKTVKQRPIIMSEPNKPEINADGIDLFILTGLPIGCKIIISDTDIITEDIIAIVGDDGEISFPTNIPGSYKIKAELFPYITKEWGIVAI